MSVLIVSELDEATQTRLKAMADAHGNSLEEEVRNILNQAATKSIEVNPANGDVIKSGEISTSETEIGFGTLISNYFKGIGVEFEGIEIPEECYDSDPVTFDE